MPASRPRVLVIDDAATIREVLNVHLGNAGYEVALAEDAVVGGRMVLECPPDLIIVDAKMPYMSGYELIAALRADEGTRHIPVVLLSSDPEAEAKGRELGVEAYLQKPVTAEWLLKTVERLVALAA